MHNVQPGVCMADWIDYYSGQRVDSLARFIALRHHDVGVGGSVPGLGSFNTVTFARGVCSRVCVWRAGGITRYGSSRF